MARRRGADLDFGTTTCTANRDHGPKRLLFAKCIEHYAGLTKIGPWEHDLAAKKDAFH
jgi:hypothetical protein